MISLNLTSKRETTPATRICENSRVNAALVTSVIVMLGNLYDTGKPEVVGNLGYITVKDKARAKSFQSLSDGGCRNRDKRTTAG